MSGKISFKKDKLIKLDIGFNKSFLRYLRKLVGTKAKPAVLFVFSLLRMSSTSSSVVANKEKEFLLKVFKYEWKSLGVLEILLTPLATNVKKLLKWSEIVRSSVIVLLSILRLILLEYFSFFTLISSKNDL